LHFSDPFGFNLHALASPVKKAVSLPVLETCTLSP
jgi:hypothetical protein